MYNNNYYGQKGHEFEIDKGMSEELVGGDGEVEMM